MHFLYFKDYNPNKEYNLKTGNELNAKKIMCIELNKTFNSIKEYALELGLDDGNICKVCKGKQKSTHNLHFKYV